MAERRHSNHPARDGRAAASLCAAIAFLCTLLIPSKALTDAPFWTDQSSGYAIGGFDPVNYFTDAQPREGDRDNEYVWAEIAWLFDNMGNLDAFRRNPEVYAPQFGGHGAFGVARGVWNQGNPRIWAVHEGRLYLFFSEHNRDSWLRDPGATIAEAQMHWRERNE